METRFWKLANLPNLRLPTWTLPYENVANTIDTKKPQKIHFKVIALICKPYFRLLFSFLPKKNKNIFPHCNIQHVLVIHINEMHFFHATSYFFFYFCREKIGGPWTSQIFNSQFTRIWWFCQWSGQFLLKIRPFINWIEVKLGGGGSYFFLSFINFPMYFQKNMMILLLLYNIITKMKNSQRKLKTTIFH